MRPLFGRKNLGRLVVAALAAGTWTLPAVAGQTSAQAATKTTPRAPVNAGSRTATSSAAKKSTKTAGKSSSRKRSKRVKGQSAPTPERISEIQDALARRGASPGTPSGKWDDSTVSAMKRFQASNGLNPTGKLDALTLQKLGLGSETAGLAAPTPPPNSTNRLRNLSSTPAEPQSEPRE